MCVTLFRWHPIFRPYWNSIPSLLLMLISILSKTQFSVLTAIGLLVGIAINIRVKRPFSVRSGSHRNVPNTLYWHGTQSPLFPLSSRCSTFKIHPFPAELWSFTLRCGHSRTCHISTFIISNMEGNNGDFPPATLWDMVSRALVTLRIEMELFVTLH